MCVLYYAVRECVRVRVNASGVASGVRVSKRERVGVRVWLSMGRVPCVRGAGCAGREQSRVVGAAATARRGRNAQRRTSPRGLDPVPDARHLFKQRPAAQR